jgi:hypothetical protein
LATALVLEAPRFRLEMTEQEAKDLLNTLGSLMGSPETVHDIHGVLLDAVESY